MSSVNVARSSVGRLLSLNERDDDYRDGLVTLKVHFTVLITEHPASVVHCQLYFLFWRRAVMGTHN